ncbi:hypothetical protein H112_08318 [Trichophyton rubrum D6]|uniref:Uncharacterized protein n=3 Tax=Trichophyton TaxID=5550 RepID=F2SDS6_TRIRC|nr:uncharacterized protein TERG_08669 [Trichophyton rubrum CBS 118892]EZF10393.1 hypothetical protein H100_08340 [Trichophyton rubrum MR850]EZF37357.1 hypothetical protein H102_08300 [Trichophyton rubrum CBS 100081]EZF47983.1 hypothetical protein H103_08323 [Trichophyton rubrum CBS 288.86]EZF58603.1 hypothetical protein H104_08273 [Trichophyton rubrum CBS 289.86]EZF69183.1 hypothetical protein H105_08327 [Trichophyton soudanense CBS 452.61]EZF79875.1 hypothetical protein H110_08323 [Trichophy
MLSEEKCEELLAYKHPQKLKSPRQRALYIWKLYDSFEISGPHGFHQYFKVDNLMLTVEDNPMIEDL